MTRVKRYRERNTHESNSHPEWTYINKKDVLFRYYENKHTREQ